MKRKKIPVIALFCAWTAFCDLISATPVQNSPNVNGNAINKFQSAMQQQNLLTTLISIEERLRNLDNIYSMQLSQTLENKLDQYHRKLESLDTKMIRLEDLIMLNLDKISENISTKNFKDDVVKTNTFRKIDSVYEGLSHRISYMDRKYETSFVKIEEKIDHTLTRLEKMEERMNTRDSDMETELSEVAFSMDDLKRACSTMEEKLLNVTRNTFNITRDNFNLARSGYVETRKSMNKLHDNIIESLKFIDDKTSAVQKVTEDNRRTLKTMKAELKEDFNEYANKVADMNNDIWKSSGNTEFDLKTIGTAINSTRVEVQNGVRSLMLQIGKLTKEDVTMAPDVSYNDEISKKLDSNFEKILINQDLFLESCHRLQMDESQIENEISVMIEKLIDMLEKKFKTELKDIKNLEKTVKSHDYRMNRNLYQANGNIISLFEKSTKHDKDIKDEVKKVGFDLGALFTFLQTTLANESAKKVNSNMKEILEKLKKIENNTKQEESSNNDKKFTNQELIKQIDSFYLALKIIKAELKNNSNLIYQEKQNINNNQTGHNETFGDLKQPPHIFIEINNGKNINQQDNDTAEIDEDTRQAIFDIFGKNPSSNVDIHDSSTAKLVDPNTQIEFLNKTQNSTERENLVSSTTKIPTVIKCKQNYRDLIDVRSGASSDEQIKCNNIKKKRKKKKQRKGGDLPQIDVRGEFIDVSAEEEEIIDYDLTTDNIDSMTDDIFTELAITPIESINDDN